MSVIHGPRPVVAVFDTAAYAMRGALHRFERASAEVARQGKNLSAGVDGDEQKSNPLAQTPPNPGPPGGAVPADLAEAMVRQNLSVRDLGVNAKMVQAFDAMLAELTRLGKTG